LSNKASALAAGYVARLSSLERTRAKVEDLYRRNLVARRDVERLYGAVFLSSVTSFESLIEELFVGLLSSNIIAPIGVRTRVAFRSRAVAREVVFAKRPYVDWLPYGHTEARAQVFFRAGRPFTGLDKADKGFLERVCLVRNALVHQSRHAQNRFTSDVIGNMALLPREKSPTGFLRSLFRFAPDQTSL
jgi:hypothetical protein